MLNERAVEYALRVAEALHLRVPERSIFSRKNYFYPDMPKNYQTSQYDEPITIDGWLDIDGVRLGVTRAHLEEDTGKSLHVGGGGRIHDADHSLVDYNRAGVPLLEIVSEPDIRSAEQAKRYVEELRATLLAVGVSDVKMEEGSLRIDANVSVRPVGTTEFGTRAEIKNLNSLRSLVHAVEYETERQVELIESGDRVVQETRHWDEDGGLTISGGRRKKHTTTGTSRSRISFPWHQPTRCAPKCTRRCRSCPPPGAPGSWTRGTSKTKTHVCSSTFPAWRITPSARSRR